MARNPLKVVLDTNVLISALVYGGNPEQIFRLVLQRKIKAVVSPVILAEFLEVLSKKFHFEETQSKLLAEKIKDHFQIIYPARKINVLTDDPDNRILEAAIETKCQYIVTGDQHLLKLTKFKSIKIVTPIEFLKEYAN